MSWSIEEHIGDCRPFPAQVVVYKGETGECLAYVSGEVADRLKAENAKLRERNRYLMKGDLLHVLTDQEYIDQCERERLMQVSIDALDKENAELRETLKLAAFVLETMEHVTSWRFEGDGKVFDSAYFYDYLQELGVTE